MSDAWKVVLTGFNTTLVKVLLSRLQKITSMNLVSIQLLLRFYKIKGAYAVGIMEFQYNSC